MDELLWKYAEDKGLAVEGLESFAEQMDIYQQIPMDYQILQLKKMLLNLSKARKSLEVLVDLYQRQEIHKLYRVSRKSLGPIRKLMLEQRNRIIADRIFDQLKVNTDRRCFFTVGAAHMAGEHGILHMLNEMGVKITPCKV